MSGDIVVCEMLEVLRAIARRFDSEIDVEAVPSIQNWCKQMGIQEDNPFLCGKTLQVRGTGRHLILLADPITEAMRASVVGALEFHGKLHPDEIASLHDLQTFAKHLLLHEVAHATGHGRSEEECDQWAFEQLRVI